MITVLLEEKTYVEYGDYGDTPDIKREGPTRVIRSLPKPWVIEELSIADSSKIYDTVGYYKGRKYTKAFASYMKVSDVVVTRKTIPISKSFVDGISITSQVTPVEFDLNRVYADAIEVTDVVLTRKAAQSLNDYNDSVQVYDVISYEVSLLAGDYSDKVTINEDISNYRETFNSIADSITVSEISTKGAFKISSFTESVSVLEAVSSRKADKISKPFSDSASLQDSITTSIERLVPKVFSDSARVLDAVSSQYIKVTSRGYIDKVTIGGSISSYKVGNAAPPPPV